MPSGSHYGRRSLSRTSLFSFIAAVFLVLSTSLAVLVAQRFHELTSGPTKPPLAPRYLVVLILDGARPDYLTSTHLPHLDALKSAGTEYDRAFAGILESETPAGHATIATGSTPARDGLLGFNWITDNNDTIHLFDPNTVRQGGMEHVMEAAGAPTIASLFKARYPKARVAAISGHKYYAADPLGGPKADYILYYTPDSKNRYVPTAIPGHVPPASVLTDPSLIWPTTSLPPGAEDHIAVGLALKAFTTVHQQVSLINLPEFDWPLGHVYGGEPGRVRTLMRGFDRDLGKIEDTYRKAGVLDRTVFVVTADHGMSSLKYQIPDSVMDDAVTQSGTTAPETTYSTAGYIWLQDPSKTKIVADAVVKKNDPHVQSVYYKVQVKNGERYVLDGGHPISAATDRANQVLLGSFLGGNAPDVVAFCDEDAAFQKKGAESWKGNHGGASWDSQHMPLIIEGPGVQSGLVSHAPARLEDIAPTALTLFGINASSMQGIVLADALQSPTRKQQQAQATLNLNLTPVVNAMQKQSAAELQAEAQS